MPSEADVVPWLNWIVSRTASPSNSVSVCAALSNP